MVLIKLEDEEYKLLLDWLEMTESIYMTEFKKAPEECAEQLAEIQYLIKKVSGFEDENLRKWLRSGRGD